MLSFLVIGDFGADTMIRRRNAQRMKKEYERTSAVLALGDNFYEYGITSEMNRRWQTDYVNVFEPVCPWFAVLGNHDYLGNIEAQIRHHGIDSWNMPARYYHRRLVSPDGIVDCDLIALDTFELSPHESMINSMGMGMPMIRWLAMRHKMRAAEQLAWLRQTLSASTARWRIVMGHYPIFSHGGGHGDNPELIRDLLPILKEFRVDFYLCGHDHNIQHIVQDETQFIVSGAGCRFSPFNSNSNSDQYRVLSAPPLPGLVLLHLFPTHAHIHLLLQHPSPSVPLVVLPNRLHPFTLTGGAI